MRALLLVGLLGLGCGPKSRAFGNALANCELGQLPSTLQAVIAEVAGVLMGGADQSWQASLTQIGARLAPGQLPCVVAAVGAGIKGKMKKGQSLPEYVEGARRADEFLAHEKK